MSNQNARKGKFHEENFAEQVRRNPRTIAQIARTVTPGVSIDRLEIVNVQTVGEHGKKSDVLIATNEGWIYRASVKSFSGNGFNQVT